MMVIRIIFTIVFFAFDVFTTFAQTAKSPKELAKKILTEPSFDSVMVRGNEVLKTGFNAGEGYLQVWARDLNTFITYSCKVRPKEEVRKALVTFFKFQAPDGSLPDGYEEVPADRMPNNYDVVTRYDMPGYFIHKNTVETDQETSVIQAVYKYVKVTGDKGILLEKVNGKTVFDRMLHAVLYLQEWRFNPKYGLLWGAATSDWGDIQPLHSTHKPNRNGTKMDEYSAPAIDIYDNAMYLIALQNLIDLAPDGTDMETYQYLHDTLKKNIRVHLWDEERQKFKPHIYITWNPFEGMDFDEDSIFYHGGTAVAIQAGVLAHDEIQVSYRKMVQNVKDANAQSVAMTMYPAYPDEAFINPALNAYQYQNGGEWTWFGGRIVIGLMDNGFIEEAYEAILPMTQRVVTNKGFYEWYTVDGKPHGSGIFRGSAGVLMEAIDKLRKWAREQR